MANVSVPAAGRRLDRERLALLHRLDRWLDGPMIALGLVWLALLVVELTRGLSPWMETLGTAIWAAFLVDFAVSFTLAPRKLDYLRRNWLTVVALLVPALRVFRLFRLFRAFRVLRAARAARGVRLVRVVTSANRGMRALGHTMRRRGVGYVVALTLLVTVIGAAGMYAFENDHPDGQGLSDYGTALWWTAMLMTTMGSDYWPRTAEGRALCLLLSLYAFAVFGYVTATIATFFLGERRDDEPDAAAVLAELRAVRRELAELRGERPRGA